ncbi:9989_t:CDS:2 [Paraglomus occultum]|uniref:9989_t:CDS:1 n=1 Tax=Paraglomus occultum TaxID=144539 RepID=A0A9N8ZM74_9GLOM|nr:9989_t:CDS:2 [Paraglomus occultum]
MSSASELAGIEVVHGLEEFQEGGEQILVLKDSTILENEEEGDRLVSIQLEEKQRLKKNLENKKKKPLYTGYDDEEFLIGGGQKKTWLSHYDEEINGPKSDSFKLGGDGTVKLSEVEKKNEISERLKARAISLQYDKMREIQDYYTKEEAEITFKKPKQTQSESNSNEDSITTQVAQSRRQANLDDVNFVDDDDLQQALARARKIASKKAIKSQPESIAESLAGIRDVQSDDEDANSSSFVISDTSEFVRALSIAPVPAKPSAPSPKPSASQPPKPASGPSSDVEQQEDHSSSDNESSRGGWKSAGVVESLGLPQIGEETKLTGVVEEEPLVSQGMAATLALLSQKGFSIKPNEEQLEKERIQKERQKWLLEQKKKDLERQLEREKEKQRAKEKGYRGGGGRENDNSYRDREHLREVEMRFRDYKPDVNLEYVDEFGNPLTPKEAFRQLSHKFHGKSSGKAKTEKRLKKLEEERKLKAMSSIDTPLNTATALQERQKASGSAHVVLSVGNRAVVPPSMNLNVTGKNETGTKASGINSNAPSIITVNGGLTGQSMNAPEREKVTFGLKRRAEQDQDKPSKKR